jgi:hypothetical protein
LNHWTAREATLRLSDSGRAALGDVFANPYVEVFVQWADESGLWILQSKEEATLTVMLVKWSHFETAILDVVLEEPQQPKVIGFIKRRSSNRN